MSKWYPDSGTIQTRAVEGFYMLKFIPGAGPDTDHSIPPLQLAKDCIDDLDTLRRQIVSHAAFHVGEPARESWNQWFKDVYPASMDVQEYIKNHTYMCPLRTFFKEGTYANHSQWSQPLAVARDEIPRFTTRIGIALPTVLSSLTPNVPIRSYVLVEGGDQAELSLSNCVQRYIDNGAEASETHRYSTLSNPELVATIKRRLKQNGHHHATSGKNKAALNSMITELNREFILMRCKPLETDESTLIYNYIHAPALLRDLDRANVTELADVVVSLEDFQTLADSRRTLSPAMMDAMMALFQHREVELCDSHKQANDKDRYYKPRSRTIYTRATNAEVR